ncbi:serine hydrolase [Weissella diestrammenae]|uniref:Serine hydrolase n=1 Tax=Weissella diestrammenae TaxID=1162633 RepID=A0A7G9T5C9_9LACO|nr:serine hydrolase [Weissella diestrammenae]MCM0583163.1 serine hydrolase [Weissella diestrammenae]QNN75304.1 serine hydrolase [Weissella diestrammenae]
MLGKFKIILCCVILLSCLVTPSSVHAALFAPQISAKSALIADAKTGQIIADQNGNEKLPIASISKLIVVYLVEQKIEMGTLKPETTVHVSKEVAEFSQDLSVANVPMSENQNYTITDLLNAALLPSSNAAATALAEIVSGSQSKFYQAANQLLIQWQIGTNQIVSASGLPNGALGPFKNHQLPDDAENLLSARDVAKIAYHLVNDYPSIVSLTNQQQANFPGLNGQSTRIKSTNLLLNQSDYHFQGLKTGATAHHGHSFVGIATFKNRPIITVVLNTDEHAPNDTIFHETETLLKQAETQVNVKTWSRENMSHTISIKNAQQQTTNLKAKQGLEIFVPTAAHKVELKFQPIPKRTAAPIAKNAALATVQPRFKNSNYNDYLTVTPKIKLTTTKTIQKKPSLLTSILDYFK